MDSIFLDSTQLCRPSFNIQFVEELWIQFSWILHSCVGQASTYSLRPCVSQSDKWLMIYGIEEAN